MAEARSLEREQPSPRLKPSLADRLILVDIIAKVLRRRSSSRDPSIESTAKELEGSLGLNLLHDPLEPRVDFIFVHGLKGGSRKTWSYSPKPGMFWPKDWLPTEDGFEHVRLHSFGYNSDWATRKKSRLSVHDFGQALLADIYNSPSLQKPGNTPIVFIAHSMGGLVVKKAYLLATRDPIYKSIAQRIHTMYFLGTPHRGADSADLARRLLQSTGSGFKAFLNELIPGAGTLDQINDEFRHVYDDLQLWSFFEGLPTSLKLVPSTLIVEKDSAVLGLPREHVQYMDANHRNICKFGSRASPNYQILRRSFLTTIQRSQAKFLSQRQQEEISHMKLISSFLRVDQRPDGTLLAVTEKQHQGSCQWLTEDQYFQRWFKQAPSSEVSPPRILWLNGQPGTGKSVAAGHVIRYLETSGQDHSFYFFRHNDASTSTIAGALRSIAFQMASCSSEVRRVIMSMIDEEVTLSGDDHRILWKKLFIDKIFTTLLDRPQFWVLDAINECSDKNGSGLVSMLSSIDSKTPVRVFITSQPGENITRLLAQNHASYVELKTGEERSLQDIELFLTAKCAHIAQDSSSPNLVADILSRSNGSFLWASITAMNLESIYSVEDMQKIMDQVPSEMDAYYSRIIDSIMQSPSAELAMCVLRWAISSPTPLSTAELADAVKLDINKTLTATPRQLEKMAGHLIVVDSQNLVQPLHHTAWHYLTEQQGGSFRIDLTDAHSRIAKICLMVLCGNGFASPRSRSGGQIHETRTEIPRPLSNYAALNFSYHILHSAPLSEDSIILLSKFFTSNILTWIERMATTGDLSTLLHTAQRLKTYIDRQAQQDGKLKDDLQIISAWLIDLYQIATVFHSYLVASPMSIHLFVPYLCPPNSMIRQLFAKRIKHQRVTGSTEDDWNDRLASFVFPNEASSLAINSRFLAVGLQSGDISLFSAPGSSTIRPVRSLTHGKKVRQVVINSSSTLLASCSPRNLKLWDISRSSDPSSHCLWSQDIDFIPSEVLFSSDGQSLVLTNPQSSSLVIFGLVDGKKEKLIPLHISSDPDSSDEEGQELTSWWTSCSRIRVDAYSKLAALSSRNSSVCIWDLAATEMLGVFDKEGHQKGVASPPVVDLIFNPVPELELLAIAYMHGDLVICNPWTLEQTKLRRLQFSIVNFGATSDGRILAGGSDDSVIHLFLFKTLQSIYRIPRPAEDLQLHQIAFSPDNLRLFDIRGQCCNVWEPLILKPEMETDSRVQDVLSDHQSLQVSTASTAQGLRWSEAIMVIEQTEDDNFLFVGRQDGSIDIFDVDAGTVIDKLQLHDQFTAVMHLDWNQDRGILLSSDTTGRCIMTELSFLSEEQKPQSKCVLDHRERQPLRQILISTSATRFLMQKDSEAKILDFRGDVLLEDSSLSQVYWTNHPTDSTVLVGVQLTQVHLYDWSSGSRISLVRGIPLTRPLESQWISIGGWVDRRASNYLARGFTTSTRPTGSTLVSLRTSNITVDSNEAVLQILELTSINMQTIIGVLRSNLYFLDTAGWVCSVNIKNLEELTQYTRHFFIPQTWQIGGDVVIRIISKSILAFARGEQLILFHGFLDFEERLALIDEAVGAG